jgi:uncharacterized protein (UPF0264 family)
MDRRSNRKLLVSVFNPQEAREAVLGGARIVDSEDPRSALGNIKPRHIMAVSDAVLNFKRDLEVQLSTNIGEDQLLFKRSESGRAIEKSPYEIAGKASQAAIGVAVSMGTRVHPCNLVKVGLDGMPLDMLESVLSECVLTLNRTEDYSHTQVMSVLFAQDLDLWDARKTLDPVRRQLVSLREFYSKDAGPEVFDLADYAVGSLRDADGRVMFTDRGQVDLHALIDRGVLPDDAKHSRVALNELFPHGRFGITDASARRTDRRAIMNMVDVTARAGADAIMLDTSILMKVARVSLASTKGSAEMIDFNALDVDGSGLPREGILSLDDVRFFVSYCHFRGLEANLAGSFLSYHAQQIWRLVPETDQVSTRGGSSAMQVDPSQSGGVGEDSRRDRVIKRSLVCGLIPPEQGGYLWLPDGMKKDPKGQSAAATLLKRYPDLTGYWADGFGNLTRM